MSAVLLLAALGALAAACGNDTAPPSDAPISMPTPPATASAPLVASSQDANQSADAAASPPPPSDAPVSMPTPAAAPTARPTIPPPSPTPTRTPLAAAPAPSPTLAPVPTQAAADDIRHGGTLNIASRRNIAHQDVHQDISAALAAWGPGIAYSRLLRFGSGEDTELPSLAVECDVCAAWTMPDHTTFEFTLRPDVVWHALPPVNARPLTAGDIAFSYERQRQDGAPNAPLLRLIDTVEAPADDRLRIRIRAADADFLGALADGHSKIVAREAVDASGDLRHGPTIGTGAWVLTDTLPDSAHTFERNPAYYEPGLPYLDGLRIHIIADYETAYAAFRVHNLGAHQLQPHELEELLSHTPSAAKRVLEHKDISKGMEIAFNTAEPPFDTLEVRQAAMLATDPWKAIADIWGGKAYVAQGVPLGEAGWQLPDDELRTHFDDPKRATQLLAQAGMALPVHITIAVGEFDALYIAHAERIADELRTAGFEPRLDFMNRRQFGERVWLGGDYQMFAGPTAPVASPNGYLLSILHSGGAWNTTAHHNDELDALITAQAQEYDADVRRHLLQQTQRIAMQNAYRFMPAASVSLWAWWPEVQGFHPNFARSEYSHWAKVWLEK